MNGLNADSFHYCSLISWDKEIIMCAKKLLFKEVVEHSDCHPREEEKRRKGALFLFRKWQINPPSLTGSSDGVAAALSRTSQHSRKQPCARSARMYLSRAHIDDGTISLFSSVSGG